MNMNPTETTAQLNHRLAGEYSLTSPEIVQEITDMLDKLDYWPGSHSQARWLINLTLRLINHIMWQPKGFGVWPGQPMAKSTPDATAIATTLAEGNPERLSLAWRMHHLGFKAGLQEVASRLHQEAYDKGANDATNRVLGTLTWQTCFTCRWATITTDYGTGIWPYNEQCTCPSVSEEGFEQWLNDGLDEEDLAATCGEWCCAREVFLV